jgi:hypothetical protein
MSTEPAVPCSWPLTKWIRVDLRPGFWNILQDAESLDFISSEKLGKGKSCVFKRIVFLQPAIPSIPGPTDKTEMKERLAMLDIEMANAARLISLNSSFGNYQLKTFLSDRVVSGG